MKKPNKLMKVLMSLGYIGIDATLVYASIDTLLHPSRGIAGLGGLLLVGTSAVCLLSISLIAKVWSD